jgi:hypothetical protein
VQAAAMVHCADNCDTLPVNRAAKSRSFFI